MMESFLAKAVIVSRRSCGKHLMFCEVHMTQATNENELDTSGDLLVKLDTVKIVFRRDSDNWGNDTIFPTKKSSLPYGAMVELELCQYDKESAQNENAPQYEVIRWKMLKDPRTEAIENAKQKSLETNERNPDCSDGISQTKYFESRMNQYLKFHSTSTKEKQTDIKKKHKLPSSSSIQCGKDMMTFSHGRDKGLRAKIFALFLVEKFGHDFFQTSSEGKYNHTHILDVAGGKGFLSFELSLLTQTQCSIIDPLIRGKKEEQQFRKRDIKRIEKANGLIPIHIAKCFVLSEECLNLVRDSIMILGLHPDQCTEDIMDAAISTNTPAAIIPCCVFSSLFPNRTLKNGIKVQTYDEFIIYLMEKDDRITKHTLDFEGMNQALVFDPRIAV
ncbi:hypothetical protein CTEN210_11427 [Chaetoceros tenuissimus]|uniref:Methyltransferase domain-containing protein n=1 Tax=Chaetoceros tenuissimus TaxID=426638 RepID=A0AAD3D1B0_9STRA|nr:hypothetical protein CTEN210_11427 [Chaetoceros tenuissimus]